MDPAILVGVVGASLLSGLLIRRLVAGQLRKREHVLQLLRERGPMSLDEIAAQTRTNAVMKGYLLQALDQLVAEGAVEKSPPPPGHPMLRRIRDTRYTLKASG